MEYTVNIFEPRINQKLVTLLKLRKKYTAVSEDLRNSFRANDFINVFINSVEFEKMLDTNIALFEDVE